MIQRTLRSTLFPYTTLFRSTADRRGLLRQDLDTDTRELRRRREPRSEEHTSELQSRFELVCRLLLEKKNEIEYTLAYNIAKRIYIDGKYMCFNNASFQWEDV